MTPKDAKIFLDMLDDNAEPNEALKRAAIIYKGNEHMKLNCICYNRVLDVEPTNNPMVIHPVYDGLIFRSTGNFGSTIFDPMPLGVEEILQVVICDDCIKAKAKRVTRIHNIKRETIAECGEFIL